MAEMLSKGKAAVIASLSQGKMRRRHKLFVAEGTKCVEDTLGVFSLRYVVCTPETEKSTVLSSLHSTSIYYATPEMMRRISSLSTPPEMLAVYDLPERGEVPAPESDVLSLLLDGVQDPGNLGTIVRSAHWFGIKRIYCSEDTVDIFNPKALMATMGSVGRVELYYCNLENLLSECRERMPIYGTLLEGENIYKAQLSQGGLIVMGNEGKGISERIKNMITEAITIPPYNSANHAESLNVGIATAVLLSQFRSRCP